MFQGLFKRSRTHEIPQQLYGSVVAQARNAEFFTRYGFEDTVTGRFDCLSLHLFLFSRRLVREDTSLANSLNQEVFDSFTADTDRALRELGIGDSGVVKRKKKMVHTFYAFVEEYGNLLDDENSQAIEALLSERFGASDAQDQFASDALAAYMLKSGEVLDAVSSQRIMAGELDWPDPADFV